MSVPIIAGIAMCLLIDSPQLIRLGSVSLSGAVTLGLVAVLLLIAPMALIARWGEYPSTPSDRYEPFVQRTWTAVPWALGLFVLYAAAVLLAAPSAEGLQNVSLYAIFALSILITSTLSSVGTVAWAQPRYAWAALIATVVFIATVFVGVEIYNERPYAGMSVVLMSILVPLRSTRSLLRIAPYLVLAGVVLSLSRMSAAICLALLVFLVVRGKRGKRLAKAVTMLTALTAAGVAVIWNYAPVRDRFFGGDNAIELDNGLTFNTSGRDELWTITINSWAESPWFGNGAGSAQAVITPMFRAIAHPHNEYLRVLHDYGILGLLLFCVGMIWLVWQTWRRARHYDEPQHWSAFMALVSLLILSVTGNPLISQFIMIPIGVLVGLSFISPPPPRASEIAYHGSRTRKLVAR